ncbi:MAG: hypothetical protein IKU10_03125, partial [Clostridia bacterium]|nr:hypothetical protein [Clostridia bacterium]
NGSDFYHSLPYKRETVYGSYFSAVIFWNVITTLAVTAIVFAVVAISPFTQLHWFSVLPYLFNILTAQFTVSAAVLLAMSVTGTAFTNLLVSLMILFVPRILLTVMTAMVEAVCVVAKIGEQFVLLDPAINTAAGLPISLVSEIFMGNSEYINCFENPLCGLYTLGLGMLYLLVAMVMLKRRKSETATCASPARWLQAIFRISLGTVVLLPAVVILFLACIQNDLLNLLSWIGIFTFVFLSALFYFLYELISTRKPKNLLRAIPGFFIVLGLGIAILLGCFGLGRSILRYSPEAKDIDYITISIDDSNYFMAQASQIHLDNPRAKEIAADGLENTIKKVKNNTISASHIYYDTDRAVENIETITLRIGFNTALGTHYRKVELAKTQYDELLGIFESNKNFKQAFYEFPDANCLTEVSFNYGSVELTSQEKEAIYASYIEEAKALPFDDWYYYATDEEAFYYDLYDAFGSITLEPVLDGKEHCVRLIITEGDFPKTSAMLAQTEGRNHDANLTNVYNLLKMIDKKELTDDKLMETDTEYADLQFNVVGQADEVNLTLNDIPTVLSILDVCEPYVGQEDKVAIYISVYYENYEQNDRSATYSLFTAIPKETVSPYMISAE